MSNRLANEDWVEHVPSNIGEQIKIHHCKMGRGNDKLYIRRVENGGIAFCHHCGQRGYVSNRILEGSTYSTNPSRRPTRIRSTGGDDSRSAVNGTAGELHKASGSNDEETKPTCTYPPDAVSDVKRWSNNEAKIWVLKYGIPMDAVNAAGISWSDYLSSILFPRYLDGELVGYQARKFPESKPKYMSFGSKGLYDPIKTPHRTHGEALGDAQRLVLVEDYLSALKVARAGCDAFFLGGTGLKDEQLARLLELGYNGFTIALDNDNLQVKASQARLHKRLSTYTRDVAVVELDKDPKEYSLEELKRLLV